MLHRFPSSFTPKTPTTCVFTIGKMSDDICQLRLEFETMRGFALETGPMAPVGVGECLGKLSKYSFG